MQGDPVALMKAFDCFGSQPDIYLVFDQRVWNRIKAAVNLDMAVEADARLAPFGIFISGGGQWLECRLIQFGEP